MYQPLPDIIYVYSILCDLKVIAKKMKIRLSQKLADIRYLCKWTTNLFLGLKLRAKDLYVGKNLQSPLCLYMYTDAKCTLDRAKFKLLM